MKHPDNRVRYTKMVLQQALLKILKEKSIDKVTVKEICEAAERNRGTFYLHYGTPNDLLREIEEQFIAENMSSFAPYMESGHEISHLANIFRCILENVELCRVIMGKHGNPRFLLRLQEMICGGVIEGWRREFPDYSPSDLNFVYDFLFAGSMRLILNWIEDDRGLSAEDLAERLDRLGHQCQLAIREFQCPLEGK